MVYSIVSKQTVDNVSISQRTFNRTSSIRPTISTYTTGSTAGILAFQKASTSTTSLNRYESTSSTTLPVWSVRQSAINPIENLTLSKAQQSHSIRFP